MNASPIHRHPIFFCGSFSLFSWLYGFPPPPRLHFESKNHSTDRLWVKRKRAAK
ncbi:hypothetical protein ZOSMA_171G00430 [Zostera marina]|uniref:Uncharacterized protein n=1 Tax=Zostera marina TaxID=29655 RepID=A0A0K9PSB0_ZOSMR|nr:hypothetical protein ZOSMA_171G00430 [Zostera marina]